VITCPFVAAFYTVSTAFDEISSTDRGSAA
jgi:hypothetical protein